MNIIYFFVFILLTNQVFASHIDSFEDIAQRTANSQQNDEFNIYGFLQHNINTDRNPEAAAAERDGPGVLDDPDFRMKRLAASRDEFRNIVMIEEEIATNVQPVTVNVRPLTVFSGSGIYRGRNEAGDIIVPTNAHCLIESYCFGSMGITVYVRVDGAAKRYRVSVVEIHRGYLFSPYEEQTPFDIAKLKLEEAIAGLPDICPDYDFVPDYSSFGNIDEYKKTWLRTINDLWRQKLVCVGYGTKGELGKRAIHDEQIRAVEYDSAELLPYCKAPTIEQLKADLSGERLSPDHLFIEAKIYSPHNLGVRKGMGGGGVFTLDAAGNANLIGIVATASGASQSKNPNIGDVSTSLALSSIRKFIESPVRSSDVGFKNWLLGHISVHKEAIFNIAYYSGIIAAGLWGLY